MGRAFPQGIDVGDGTIRGHAAGWNRRFFYVKAEFALLGVATQKCRITIKQFTNNKLVSKINAYFVFQIPYNGQYYKKPTESSSCGEEYLK